MKCENCIHYDVCYKHMWCEDCNDFKDKSLFVELPCRCKDCEYLRKSFVGHYYCDNDKNGDVKKYTDLNEYCSYAEKKLKEMQNESNLR